MLRLSGRIEDLVRAKSAKESWLPVLGKGKPVMDKDMDLIAWKAKETSATMCGYG